MIISNKRVKQNFWPKKIKKTDYVLGDGKLPSQVLMTDGHGWGDFLPIAEVQSKNGLETNCCPAYGTLNAWEAIGRKRYGVSFQSNLSERYLSVMSGMNGNGGFPFNVAETMRYIGAIPEVYLPFDKTITTLQKYFSPKPMSYALFKVGFHWLKKYDPRHSWVFTGGTVAEKQAKLKEALKYSPVGVSGYAWSLHGDDMYYKDGQDIHWFVIFDYVEKDGKLLYWLAFDTYSPFIKKIEPNYDFGYAEMYSLDRKLGSETVSDEPQECKLEYYKYLIKDFISSILKR